VRGVLILVPCSGSKKTGGTTEYSASSCIFNYLTSAAEHLLSLRRKLFDHFSIPLGQDVGCADHGTIMYMDAYRRYTGAHSQIYRQITCSSWEKLGGTQNLDLATISALYGLLRYDEPIQDYNVCMRDKIGHQTLKTWWRNNGLCTIVKDYIKQNNTSEVYGVLSSDYSEALRECFGNVSPEHPPPDFSRYGSGSNAHRGKWIDYFIQSF